MADDRTWSWWAAEGADAEWFVVNEPTREGALAVARREFGAGATITIVEATQDGPFETELFDEESVELLIDKFVEANGERFGENGFDGHIDHGLLAEAMNGAFAAFMDAHGSDVIVSSFTEERNKEVIPPAVRAVAHGTCGRCAAPHVPLVDGWCDPCSEHFTRSAV